MTHAYSAIVERWVYKKRPQRQIQGSLASSGPAVRKVVGSSPLHKDSCAVYRSIVKEQRVHHLKAGFCVQLPLGRHANGPALQAMRQHNSWIR